MSIVRQYKNKPKVINAFQYNGELVSELKLSHSLIEKWDIYNRGHLDVSIMFYNKIHATYYEVNDGDYLAWQNEDDPYPISKDVFEKSYYIIPESLTKKQE